jgi:hypothetical protein
MGIEQIMQQAKEAYEANQQAKQQVPLDMVDADNLPREAPLKYEFLCRIVGALYIEHQLSIEKMSEQHQAIVSQLQSQINELMSENKQLRGELEHGNQSPVATSD